ncbi:MAG: hypothetical protein ACOVQX_03415 [Legionella sp.]
MIEMFQRLIGYITSLDSILGGAYLEKRLAQSQKACELLAKELTQKHVIQLAETLVGELKAVSDDKDLETQVRSKVRHIIEAIQCELRSLPPQNQPSVAPQNQPSAAPPNTYSSSVPSSAPSRAASVHGSHLSKYSMLSAASLRSVTLQSKANQIVTGHDMQQYIAIACRGDDVRKQAIVALSAMIKRLNNNVSANQGDLAALKIYLIAVFYFFKSPLSQLEPALSNKKLLACSANLKEFFKTLATIKSAEQPKQVSEPALESSSTKAAMNHILLLNMTKEDLSLYSNCLRKTFTQPTSGASASSSSTSSAVKAGAFTK